MQVDPAPVQPQDATDNPAYKGFTNSACPFYPCHPGVRREFNCLFCYCPLIAYACPGPYRLCTDRHGLVRKDCSDCRLPHDGHAPSWSFIQRWLERPHLWDGQAQRAPYAETRRRDQ